MNRNMVFTTALIICLVPFVYLWTSWSDLPNTVPTHFGVDGKPDGFGSKMELLYSLGILTLIGFGTFLLLLNINKIDPKKSRNSPAVMAKIAFAVLVLIVFIECMIVNSAHTGTIKFDRFLLPAMGLFFAFLGNVFYSVKPNYFVGIRTPWALESEENWRRTHQLAGKLWFGAGLISALLTLIFPFHIAAFVFIAIAFTIAIIPIVFSYTIFKKSQHS